MGKEEPDRIKEFYYWLAEHVDIPTANQMLHSYMEFEKSILELSTDSKELKE